MYIQSSSSSDESSSNSDSLCAGPSRRKSKQSFGSDTSSESEAVEEGKRNLPNADRTEKRRNYRLRYRQDSEDSEDDDGENGNVRFSRKSALEAAKRLKYDFATSSDDDDEVKPSPIN